VSYWAPVDIDCRPPVEITRAGIAAVPGVEGIGLKLCVRNNRSDRLTAQASVAFGGDELAADLWIDPGETQDLLLKLDDTEALTPGQNVVKLRFGEEMLIARARLWRLFEAVEDRHESFADECKQLEFERNDTLSEIFAREYTEGNAPQLNNWTWYRTETINTDAMRERAQDGVLMTHVGVPFAVSVKGQDGLYVSRWDPFPRSARVQAGARGDKLYLLLANHTHNSQTHMVQAAVVLEYADGTRTRVPLKSPEDIDGMLQHYSGMAPEWIGGREQGWYGHGRASGVHADVTDIELDPTRELASFEVQCLTEETLVGLLGATVHTVR